jgi:hypothetical protein
MRGACWRWRSRRSPPPAAATTSTTPAPTGRGATSRSWRRADPGGGWDTTARETARVVEEDRFEGRKIVFGEED